MKNKLFALAIIFLVFSACKKNDSSSGAASKTTLLTQQPWLFDKAGLDPDKNGSIDTDISGFVSGCLKDNSVSFVTGGSGTADEGATKCNSGDPQTIPFTWNFASSETEININGNAVAGKGGKYKIVGLTTASFSLSKDTVYQGISTTFVVNLKH